MNTYEDRMKHPKPSAKEEKYARMVFEVEVPKDASEEEICNAMEDRLTTFLQDHWGIDDIEIHNRPYIADECDSDIIETETGHATIQAIEGKGKFYDKHPIY